MPTNNSGTPAERAERLTEALINGSIQEADFDSLVKLVGEDATARATYIDCMNVHSALRQNYLSHAHADEDHFDLLTNFPTEREVARTTRSGYYLAAIAAALLISSGLILLNAGNDSGETTPQIALSEAQESGSAETDSDRLLAEVESVAVVTRLVNVVWEDGEHAAGINTPLPRQQLSIKSGLMQIEFYCGAAVIIEGPATFDLVAPDRGYAHYGKLRAHVPARARGFTIGTKSGNIVDLGTEFGLEISEDGQSELHVIDGEVDFHETKESGTALHRLVGGQGIGVSLDGEPLRRIESDASRFVDHNGLSSLASQNSRGNYQRWLDYHTRLRNDPAIVADYVFEDLSGWGRTLVNAASGADKASYGAVVGASWEQGRWPGSKALRFQSPSDRVRIKLDGEFDSLSIAAWVNLQEVVGKRSIALLHPEIDHQRDDLVNPQRFIHWTLNPTPHGVVLHFAESCGHGRGNRNHYSSKLHGIRSNELGTWVHVAVVYDPEAQAVSHYRNGELLATAEIKLPRKLAIGTADLCNWPYQGWAANTQFEFRNLNGLMDEFVVLERALSAEEIAEMHEVGKP